MTRADTAAAAIVAALERAAPGWRPRVGLVLGSGLGPVAAAIDPVLAFSYGDIPGFPTVSVAGHAGRLILGRLGGCPLACLQGRVHLFEGASAEDIRTPVRTLKLLGCDVLVLTNAAGSLRPDSLPGGNLMVIADHINMTAFDPLTGVNDDAFGPRFPAMADAYDPALRDLLHRAAAQSDVTLQEGVYMACRGPSFETPAEIRAFQRLGGDAVGMSTVFETIVARHCGMRVAAISAVVCPASGLGPPLSHEQTLAAGEALSARLARLLPAFLQHLGAAHPGTDGPGPAGPGDG